MHTTNCASDVHAHKPIRAIKSNKFFVLPCFVYVDESMKLRSFLFKVGRYTGQANELTLMALTVKICQEDPPRAKVPPLRRLFFESYTLAAADMRSRLDRKDCDEPRRLAQAERASRHASQVTRLNSLDLTGELEPSHALIDTVFPDVGRRRPLIHPVGTMYKEGSGADGDQERPYLKAR